MFERICIFIITFKKKGIEKENQKRTKKSIKKLIKTKGTKEGGRVGGSGRRNESPRGAALSGVGVGHRERGDPGRESSGRGVVRGGRRERG